MSGEESGEDCFSTVSCDPADYYLCKRKDQCLEAAENLERMTGTAGQAGVPFRIFVAWRKERWGLSGLALREMRPAYVL